VKNYFSSNFKLGVLGGGQLGRMLLTETQKFDIYTLILDGATNAPCADICNEFHLGDLMDYQTVYNFGKKVDLLTIEIEHVNIEALLQLEKEGLTIYPQASVLKTIQHKGIQKDFFKNNDIPTANYKRFTSIESLKKEVRPPFVWKSAQFGYDGMGVKVVRSASDFDTLSETDCIVEDLIPFKNELAVIVARNMARPKHIQLLKWNFIQLQIRLNMLFVRQELIIMWQIKHRKLLYMLRMHFNLLDY